MPDTRYIAIVDDHTMFRKGLAALVNLFPRYEVLFQASDGREMIERLKYQRLPDIILLDVTMPRMDGYEAAEWLRQHQPDIHVLALSTMESEIAIIKMIRHGAKGYILKDAEPEELKLAFDEVCSRGFFFNDLVTRKVMQSISQLVNENSPLHALVKLSQRELEFIRRACSEKSYQEIAKEMFVSERTVDGYREALFRKLNVSTRVGLVLYAVKHNLVVI
ncbi:response regulator transcription factor [Chitinophaga japonensis]|uniref:Two component transcriptional regulator, LuxR family n=1 Tax=Chitinophaga japonensis TaxID=104662 RepID=A0A562SL03_CHIJA|nr:response regulator transcription factor [Chitinophaga japonensis]TWI81987.1 two component transcriptional regulator, LuxR family [Chitinophaga japonensis]